MDYSLLVAKKEIEASFIKDGYKITEKRSGYDVVISGDTLKEPQAYGDALLCNVDHGPGIKTLRYRNFLRQKDTRYVVFVEGRYRIEKFKKYGLDKKHTFIDVGLPKHDPLLSGAFSREEIIQQYGLDPEKKIVVYAPSYKPTSIFMIGDKLLQLLNDYNVLVKLHPYSWAGKYASHSQHRFFEKMCSKDHRLQLVPAHEHNMLPYLWAADTMISEGSSVINEFLALERCGIIVNLPDENLRHSDGQPHLEENSREWLKGSFVHLENPDQLLKAVETALNPDTERIKKIKEDREFLYTHVDGKASKRLKKAVEELLEQK
ncbi:CDP-glycerol glycerophosphotransferase family protein [Chitinispirillales bacterium ANBcel5]|uniref:CDP-glycerol glycerophosphotransferase family protein n=1 Tax=Cellulosispirillum alkaliphilum TaxID=3039283 RepID=UPI002A577233|nr:CDP-glycerol glycerophosphotransferase family protein [Chitinispirillales bacterium ANBcel5]